MGNCMSPISTHRPLDEGAKEEEEKHGSEKFEKGGGLKVKIVLTREELEWLMYQLKVNGGKKLEDLLREIERGKGKGQGWKPSLESIMETSEGLEME